MKSNRKRKKIKRVRDSINVNQIEYPSKSKGKKTNKTKDINKTKDTNQVIDLRDILKSNSTQEKDEEDEYDIEEFINPTPYKMLSKEEKDIQISWLEKYRPQKMEDYIGQESKVLQADTWITEFKQNKPDTKKFLILYGAPGIGKTTLSHLILRKHNYDVIEFNSSDMRNKKAIKRRLGTIGKKSICQVLYDNNTSSRGPEIAVIMDEIDGINSGERGSISTLIEIMCPKKKKNKNKRKNNKIKDVRKFPIIFTCNKVNEKKLAPIRKEAVEIKLDYPTDKALLIYAKKIIKAEKIKIDDDNVKIIVKRSMNDFRKLVNLLYYLHLSDIPKNEDDLGILIDNLEIKEQNQGIYTEINQMFNDNMSFSSMINIADSDPKVVSQIIYKNYISIIMRNRKGTNKTKSRCISNAARYISEGDSLHNNIFSNQYWGLIGEMSTMSCLSPCVLSKHNLSKMTSYSYLENYSDLNRTYQDVSTYNRGILQLKQKIKCGNIDNIDIICRIILDNLCCPNGDFTYGIRLINKYKLSIKDIELMTRMTRKSCSKDYEQLYKKRKREIMKYIR